MSNSVAIVTGASQDIGQATALRLARGTPALEEYDLVILGGGTGSTIALAVDGGEIMASVQTAMMAGLPYTALRDAIWAHPTLVEGLIPLFSSEPSLSVPLLPERAR